MWFTSLLPSRKRRGGRRPQAHRHPARERRPFVPRLEGLEDRTVLSTLTVLNNLDKGAGSLRDAILNAKSGDTIVFAPSLDGQTITLTSDQLTINKSLDIEGPGASLLAVSGNDTNRVFNINEGLTVTIAGLTITHGRTVGNNGGAGIQNVGSTLTLANDVLSDNVAFGDPNLGGRSTFPVGGAVRSRNSATLTVTHCTFTANQAVGTDGGGNAWGGGIANDTGSVATVTGCTFTGNRAVGGDGGKSSSGQPILGHGEGGGIANFSTLTVTNSTFAANQAIGGNGCQGGSDNTPLYTLDVGNGGGIENFPQGSVLFVDGCTFAYNQAIGGSNAVGSPGGQLGRLGNASGGGVKNEAVATITNSTFDHNEAIGGSGNTGTASVVLNGVGQGGGIDNGTVGFAATLTASNLTITNNRAVGGAGNTGTAFAGSRIEAGPRPRLATARSSTTRPSAAPVPMLWVAASLTSPGVRSPSAAA
jgi:hypothetical protein